jgi:DNA-binding NarL/FixJ family response regulator
MDENAASGSTSKLDQLNSQLLIPSTIFCDRSLSFLESLVEYLKDQFKLSYHEISVLTNRDERNIWTLYNRASKKRNEREPIVGKAHIVNIPLSVVTDRSLSILEVVVEYMRDKAQFTNHEIAVLLNRSDKTVSTVYMRTKKKRSKLAKAM